MEQGKEPSRNLHLTAHECARQEDMTYFWLFAGDFGWHVCGRPDDASFVENAQGMTIVNETLTMISLYP
jgi:hypothetical protein